MCARTRQTVPKRRRPKPSKGGKITERAVRGTNNQPRVPRQRQIRQLKNIKCREPTSETYKNWKIIKIGKFVQYQLKLPNNKIFWKTPGISIYLIYFFNKTIQLNINI